MPRNTLALSLESPPHSWAFSCLSFMGDKSTLEVSMLNVLNIWVKLDSSQISIVCMHLFITCRKKRASSPFRTAITLRKKQNYLLSLLKESFELARVLSTYFFRKCFFFLYLQLQIWSLNFNSVIPHFLAEANFKSITFNTGKKYLQLRCLNTATLVTNFHLILQKPHSQVSFCLSGPEPTKIQRNVIFMDHSCQKLINVVG